MMQDARRNAGCPERKAMPLYEYRCEDCETAFEKLVRAFREDVHCPECGSGTVERLLSTFAMSTSSGFTPSSGGGCGCGRGGCGCGR
jgi:putative FmdB family regulatory protein